MRTKACFKPLEIVHVDLGDGFEALSRGRKDNGKDVYAVLWKGGVPLGHLELARSQLEDLAPLRNAVARAIAPAVGGLLLPGHEPSPYNVDQREETESDLERLISLDHPLAQLEDTGESALSSFRGRVSVVVCTRDRPEMLERCLDSLITGTAQPDEIIVVDNFPSTDGCRAVVGSRPEVTYVAEPHPGLSRARNAGIRAARGDIIAFTDDDTVVHPDWIKRLSDSFQDPKVMSVTGLVLPAALDAPSQVAFEKGMGGLGKGYARVEYDAAFISRTTANGTSVWEIGAGANMAIRRAAFEALGGFDERLGAGAAGCSEDSEFWYRILAAGWNCLYEPAAVVFHHHRKDFGELKAQARLYMRGHVGALFVQFARHGGRGNLYRPLTVIPVNLVKRAIRDFVLSKKTGLFSSYLSGYLRGLLLLPWAFQHHSPVVVSETKTSSGHKADRRGFLNANPYSHPNSVGLFYREKMSAIHTVAPEGPFARILEVGGGQSGLTALLYPGAQVVNMDLEPTFARSRYNQRPGMSFVCGDATRLPFPDASFNAVTLFDVLEHVPDDARAALEVLRVLRPGGFVMISSPNQQWRFPYYRMMAPLCPTDEAVMAEWGHVRRGYAKSDLRALMGVDPIRSSSYITPITVIGHDLAFSKLPGRLRPLACILVSPITWLGYWVNRRNASGIETAASWRSRAERYIP
jgi:GT2 family glycosyltransferase/SAM-dependent methyltransferase